MKMVIFAVDEEELPEGIEKLTIVIERQMSYFATSESLDGLLDYLGDNHWAQTFYVTAEGFTRENPRKPFALWEVVDAEFRDLVGKMTDFDSVKRVTASEASKHSWFADAESAALDNNGRDQPKE